MKEKLPLILNDKQFEYILRLIYNSSDSQAYHNTNWMDTFSKESIQKVRELIQCDEHEGCRILSQLK